ncbi:DoxX family protein [Streptomyces sp. NPDC050504]|uniref:DoxX family protein n=1 Tax=Streptomyces sp. NPDC050504 TaxID=3365618 RepID=UPI0037943950
MTAPTASAAALPTAVGAPSRRTHLAVRGLQVLLALFFAVPSASPKLVGHSSAVESFDRIGWGDWLMYAVGGVELAGAVALLVPALAGAAAIGLIALMAGAFVMQLTVLDPPLAVTPLVFAVLLAVVARVRRRETAELIARVRGRAA